MRETISGADPHMFFSYNNGISATAEKVVIKNNKIVEIKDFQIVNGGQTTASLFWAREEGADIDDIIVQMKLTVIHDKNRVDALVAKMSEYSNTQNKVSPVDQHAKLYPHPQLGTISQKTPAPADGAQLTFWFYERMRGEYQMQKMKLEFHYLLPSLFRHLMQ